MPKTPRKLVPQGALVALERLAQPEARLLLVGAQNYILAEDHSEHHGVRKNDLQALIEQGWISTPVACGPYAECDLTPAGRAHYRRILKLRSANSQYQQGELPQFAQLCEQEAIHA
jgi:hypothetical protein